MIKKHSQPYKNYTSIINITDFKITVNNASDNPYPYENPIPIKEMFVISSGQKNIRNNSLTYNNSFENARIIHENILEPCLFKSFTNYFMIVTSYEYLNDYNYSFGNLTYIANEEQVPNEEDQEGRVFLFEDVQETIEKLENLTNAFGSIIINQGTPVISNSTAEKVNCSVVRINNSDGSKVKELLENDIVLVEDLFDNLTFTYNFTEQCFPPSDFFIIDREPDHYELENIIGNMTEEIIV